MAEKKSPEEIKSDKALEKFNRAYREDAAEKVLATREWLLGHIKETIPIRIKDHHIKIRQRLTTAEQRKFINVYKLWGETSEESKISLKKKTQAQKDKFNLEVSKFLAYIITNPKLEAEDIDKAFQPLEMAAIMTEFFKATLTDIDAETLQFFL